MRRRDLRQTLPPDVTLGQGGLLVYVIDDQRVSALLIEGYLEDLDGVASQVFTDPVVALQACAAFPPDLVLVDYSMPGMSGVDFLRRLRQLDTVGEVPVVVVTAKNDRDTLYRALTAGANDFLRKPIDRIELRARARNMLALRSRELAMKDQQRELEAANERLRELATVDSLTRALNRRTFVHRLDEAVARCRRYGGVLSVAMVDADHFKHINDTHGHAIGDDVLRAMSSSIRSGLREVDLFGRLGGEEFAIAFPETSGPGALRGCDRLRERIRSVTVLSRGKPVDFTVSVGVAELQEGESAQQVLSRADRALYVAKRQGRDQVVADRPDDATGERVQRGEGE